MNEGLTRTQKAMAIQRLTALWAFGESGLGGVLHAFQVPFTGLLVGSVSVICICMLGIFSEKNYNIILKSLLLVLIVKAVVSPQTPFPAYIAVSFQGFLAYALFYVTRINFLSILFLSVIAMIESAIQKLLVLTLFFGNSFWNGLDEFVKLIGKPFGTSPESGSLWIVGIYLCIYVAGGIFTAVIASRLCAFNFPAYPSPAIIELMDTEIISTGPRRSFIPKFVLVLAGFSILLFAPAISRFGSAAVLRSLVWTVTAVVMWYAVISPLVTKFLRSVLMRSNNVYKVQAFEIISFLPFMRKLTLAAWHATADKRMLRRIPAFLIVLISMLLTFQQQNAVKTV
jgi:hypothetical protein